MGGISPASKLSTPRCRPQQGFPTQSNKDGKRSQEPSGGENQWGFCPLGGRALHPKEGALQLLQHQPGEFALDSWGGHAAVLGSRGKNCWLHPVTLMDPLFSGNALGKDPVSDLNCVAWWGGTVSPISSALPPTPTC